MGKIFSFADDTALLISAESWEEAYKIASREISAIFYWLRESELKMNISKTQYMTFSPNISGQPSDALKVKIHDNLTNLNLCLENKCNTCQCLQNVPSAKYLGVFVDKYLKWEVHIDYITKKLRGLIYFFKIISDFANESFLRQIYYAMAQSIMQYCILVWGSASPSLLNPLFIAQKYLLKILLKKPIRYPTKKLFTDCNLLTISSLYELELAKWAIKHRFIENIHITGYTTRSEKNYLLKTTKANLSICYNSIYNNCVKAFNELPTEIKKLDKEGTSYFGLTKRIKKTILEKQKLPG